MRIFPIFRSRALPLWRHAPDRLPSGSTLLQQHSSPRYKPVRVYGGKHLDDAGWHGDTHAFYHDCSINSKLREPDSRHHQRSQKPHAKQYWNDIFIAVRYHGQRWQLERFPGIEYLRQHFSVWGNLHIVGQFQAKLRCSRDDGHSRQRKSARISPSRDGNRNRHIRDHQRRPGGYTLGNICL